MLGLPIICGPHPRRPSPFPLLPQDSDPEAGRAGTPSLPLHFLSLSPADISAPRRVTRGEGRAGRGEVVFWGGGGVNFITPKA